MCSTVTGQASGSGCCSTADRHNARLRARRTVVDHHEFERVGRAVAKHALDAGSYFVHAAIDGNDDRHGPAVIDRLREARPTEDAIDDRHAGLGSEQQVAAARQSAELDRTVEAGREGSDPLIRTSWGDDSAYRPTSSSSTSPRPSAAKAVGIPRYAASITGRGRPDSRDLCRGAHPCLSAPFRHRVGRRRCRSSWCAAERGDRRTRVRRTEHLDREGWVGVEHAADGGHHGRYLRARLRVDDQSQDPGSSSSVDTVGRAGARRDENGSTGWEGHER